nr:NADH dehydrogenase subunit 4L [Haania vitalisi]
MLSMFCFIFFCGIWVFSFKGKHLLMTLMSLEFILLVLFMMIYYYMLNMYNELYLTMFYLSFVVCEGALGLSIMVAMIRTHGNDYFNSFDMLLC